MCLAQGPQRRDAGEARTRGLSVSSQALKIQLFQNMVMLHIKLNGITNAATW